VSGDVDFTGGMTGHFELRTFSGSIESNLGSHRSASSALDFRSGNGSAKVRGRTFSGDIEIEPKH
jgi:hypothetical protein